MTITHSIVKNSPFKLLPHSISEPVTLLKRCTRTSEITQLHSAIIKHGLDNDQFIVSKLLASTSLKDIEYAAQIFSHAQSPNLFMYNTMLRGYSISGDLKRGLVLFNELRDDRTIGYDEFSFIGICKACARGGEVGFGLGVHGVVLKAGVGVFVNVKNSLLQFYSVCGRIGDAQKLFDESSEINDSVSWNTLMGGYLRVYQPGAVVELFRNMRSGGDVVVSASTVLGVLSAADELRDCSLGMCVHGLCVKVGLVENLYVVTALIEMYAKTGHIELGRGIFDGIVEKDVVLWNCLIDGYAKSGMLEEPVALLEQMKLQGLKPNSSTLAGMLRACAAGGTIAVGQHIVDYVEEEQLALDTVLGTALVDMYAKCGVLEKAVDIFNKIDSKDVKTWTAMILGYGVHGKAKKAIELFCRMEEEGFIPNEVTFLAILNASSHGGLVEEGKRFFVRMVQKYGILPKVEHYGCMVDLMGRAGLLEEAFRLIQSLHIKTDATAWRALLAACRVYGNIELGERVRRILAENYDEHPTDSILLSSTYAISGMLHDYAQMQTPQGEEMTKQRLKKVAGLSKVEMGRW